MTEPEGNGNTGNGGEAAPAGEGGSAPAGEGGPAPQGEKPAAPAKESAKESAEEKPKATPGKIHIEMELTRDIGLVTALSIGVGTMIAAGIFTLSGLAVAEVGSAAIVAFLLAALVATFTALTYCEFSSIYPESGEGYLYARKTFAAPAAYIVGWCLLLGYTSSCGFYLASLSVYFNEFILHGAMGLSEETVHNVGPAPGLVALVILTLLNIKGTKESGTFQVIITAGKVVLLMVFVVGGFVYTGFDGETLGERFTSDMLKIGSTAALVFITFFGFSAIAASAGEVENPTKTIPRAIFISMALVSVLYTAVVLVIVLGDIQGGGEEAMGVAALKFLGSVGQAVIVGGALFSMISASNASIMAGSRVALSMSQLGHLPKEIGAVNEQTRTPVVATLLVGGGIGVFAAMLPLKDLAHFADCVLLSVLILVNIALIMHRRMFPNLKRPFRVPLVPLLPGLGIIANIYLLIQIITQGYQQGHLLPVYLSITAVVLGFLAYLAWKGAQVAEEVAMPGERSRVALERSAGAPGLFRVLVPLANPANVDQLVDLAAIFAKERKGEIVAIRVVVVPDQLPPSLEDATVEREAKILELARSRALAHDVPITSLVRVGHNAARAILETARERSCDLIVLGWKGWTSTGRRILGEITDDVVRYARSDIMLVKLVGTGKLKRLILPSAGGDHAKAALAYAADMLRSQEGGSLTLCSVVAPDAPQERVESEEERLSRDRDTVEGVDTVETKLIRHRSVSDGILEEGEKHDAIVLGAAGQSFSSQIMFGTIPENIARESHKPVIVVKRYHAVKALVGRVLSE